MKKQEQRQEGSLFGEASGSSGRGRGWRKLGTFGDVVSEKEAIVKKHVRMDKLMCRPNYGKLGEPIPLRANFKLLAIRPNTRIYCYDVKVMKYNSTEETNRDVCREKFWEAVSKNEQIFHLGYSLVYDDSHALFSLNKLLLPHSTLEIQLWPEAKPNFQPTHPSYTVVISPTNYSFILNADEHSNDCRISMHLLDCLVTQRARCPFMNMSKSFYPFKNCLYMLPCAELPWRTLNIGPGMEAWNGLYGAVKRCEKGLLLNVDVSTKVFYKIDMMLMDFYAAVLNEFVGKRTLHNIGKECHNFAMSSDQRQRLKDALKGLMLKVTYDDRHVKFVDIGQPARTQRFVMNNNEELTVEEYFRRFKNINLQFPNLPVIHCGRKTRPEYFPMELLRLSDKAQRVKKRLTPFQVAKLIRGTALNPLERFERIDWLVDGIRLSTDDEFMQHFGITFPSLNEFHVPESVRVPGRILPPPTVEFKTLKLTAKDGFWRLEDGFFLSPNGVFFSIVLVNEAIEVNAIKAPLNTLIHACKLFGMTFAQEDFEAQNVKVYHWNTRSEDAVIHVHDFKKMCSKIAKCNIKPLLIFIVPQKNDEIYGRIKVACDKEEGVACQVILAETFLKMQGSVKRNTVSHNICLKINSKLGGINNQVAKNQNYWKKFTDKESATLFLGIDVTHPPSGDTTSPSIVSIVGSLNIDATRYAASTKIQEPRKEVVPYVMDAFRARILEFDAHSGCKPQHIVLFRDGVSDSEFLDVMNEELFCLKAATYQLNPLYEPTISYVVVQKRHHTRFVAENENLSRGNKNIPPGTVVDRAVTSSSLFDFYLCSHLGAIGTSRPSHYIVLYDSWHLSADEWQQMAYALCHIYARCNKSVSIPAPVYYAHLACDRAKRLLKYGLTCPSAIKPTIHALEQSCRISPDTPSMYFI